MKTPANEKKCVFVFKIARVIATLHLFPLNFKNQKYICNTATEIFGVDFEHYMSVSV